MEDVKLLIIEDEQKIADTLKAGLMENGYLVEVAYDGETGYQKFQKDRYHLILLDVNIPIINGYQLSRLIRSNNTEVLIIMLTALSSLDDILDGYDAGADDYLVKPFEFKELLLKIRVLLKRAIKTPSETENVLRASDLELNLASKQVRRGSSTIKLTFKEFSLLQYLLENKNRVVSRTDVMQNVWGLDFNTNTNIIDVYINYLRNKVDRPFEHKLIQTHVGTGYILKET